MARNVEIKARIDSVAVMLPRALALASRGPEIIYQDDTFFRCERGRLKLRQFDARQGQLIFYERADRAGPKTSFYEITLTTEPDKLRSVLSAALGEIGRVRKRRTLLMAGRTRIHLDEVQGLGDFLELEVVLAASEPEADGLAEAHVLMQSLGIAADSLIEGAYLDLLLQIPD